MPVKNEFTYKDGDVNCIGYYAFHDDAKKKPGVLVCHDWSGKNKFSCGKADALAELGYVGFALDMYGDGKTGKTKDEKIALIQPLMQNRKLLQSRVIAGYEALKSIEVVDKDQIGVIGFCFGGLCALDLARSGVPLSAAISFHGLLGAPQDHATHKPYLAKILVLHGFDDPMVTPDQVVGFAEEMNEAKADWEIDIYGNTMHAFTNPEANDPGFGTVYNETADKRSFEAMRRFLAEAFV